MDQEVLAVIEGDDDILAAPREPGEGSAPECPGEFVRCHPGDGTGPVNGNIPHDYLLETMGTQVSDNSFNFW
jgi:hypothetical protein